LAALLGFLGAVCLVGWYGLSAVGGTIELAGWLGFAAMIAYHMVPVALCALAWRTLFAEPRPSWPTFVWFRWVRDAGSDLLALLPGTGEMLGIRAMKLGGVDVGAAAATTVVDTTVEMAAQLAFTFLGLVIMLDHPKSRVVAWTLIGLAVITPLVCGLIFAQRIGLLGLLERFAGKLALEFGWTLPAELSGIEARIHKLYENRRALARAGAIHLIAWIVGVGEAGIALAMMGVRPGIGTLIVLESLTFALRTAAFFVPAAAGVQEGGYVLLGGALGIGPDFTLALSLMKRGRELVLGTVALLLWHVIESRRLWLKTRGERSVAGLSSQPLPDSRLAPSDHPGP
jgi:putative membrane protein